MKTTSDSLHGKLKQLEFSIFIEEEGLIIRAIFAICDEQPIFLWKIILENQSNEKIIVNSIEMLNIGGNKNLEKSYYFSGNKSSKPAYSFFSNGWQSWSFSGTYRDDQIQRQTRLKYFQDVLVQNPGTPIYRNQGHFTGDFYGVIADRNARTACLIGFLSQKKHFGSIDVDIIESPKIRLWANGDQTVLAPSYAMETDWAIIFANYIDQPDPFSIYYNAVMIENDVTLEIPLLLVGARGTIFIRIFLKRRYFKIWIISLIFKRECRWNWSKLTTGLKKKSGIGLFLAKAFQMASSYLLLKLRRMGLRPVFGWHLLYFIQIVNMLCPIRKSYYATKTVNQSMLDLFGIHLPRHSI